MGLIYIIKNHRNNKVYVGQTTTSMKQRWNHHINKKCLREGFVYRSQDGQKSFKNVSRKFLLKAGE